MSSVKGKSVIVTGSSSGIGLATAVLFSQHGANVTVCGRDAGRLQEAVAATQKAGKEAGQSNRVISVQGDITTTAVIQKTVAETVKAFGQLDVLVSNHGIAVNSSSSETIAEWTRDMFDLNMNNNVRSVIELIKEAVPHLEKTKGNIVCVSSLGSTMPIGIGMNYLLTKAAMDHMVRCLALQLGPKGIRINCTNPTWVATRLTRGVDPSMLGFVDIIQKVVAQEQPLQGQASGPEEQAEVIVFLASDAARLVHGQCIAVDGGLGLKGQPPNFPALFAPYMSAPAEGQK